MDEGKRAFLQIQIVRFVDQGFPGFVAGEFLDAHGKRHTVIDKIPVIGTPELWKDSHYPQPSSIQCEIVETPDELADRGQVRVNIDRPWGLETTDGSTEFVVHQSQVTYGSD
jgi:hypothetical protein